MEKTILVLFTNLCFYEWFTKAHFQVLFFAYRCLNVYSGVTIWVGDHLYILTMQQRVQRKFSIKFKVFVSLGGNYVGKYM